MRTVAACAAGLAIGAGIVAFAYTKNNGEEAKMLKTLKATPYSPKRSAKSETAHLSMSPHHKRRFRKAHDFLSLTKQNLIEIFNRLDVNKDGVIEKKELLETLENDPHTKKLLKGVMHAAGIKKGKDMPAAMIMRQLDVDGDGTITRSEFFRKLFAEVHIVKLFHEYDVDEDGYLNESEFKTFLICDPEVEVMLTNMLEDIVVSALTSFLPILAETGGASKEDETLRPVTGMRAMANRFFQQLQVDNKVSLEAFLTRLHLHEHVVNIYRKMDKDGDGSLCKAEVLNALRNDKNFAELSAKCHAKRGLTDIFDALDLNGDGKVTLEEMISRLG